MAPSAILVPSSTVPPRLSHEVEPTRNAERRHHQCRQREEHIIKGADPLQRLRIAYDVRSPSSPRHESQWDRFPWIARRTPE